MSQPEDTRSATRRIFVTCSSGVARKRLLAELGPRRSWYRTRKPLRNSRGIYLVTQEEYERVKGLRGVSRTKDAEDMAECW